MSMMREQRKQQYAGDIIIYDWNNNRKISVMKKMLNEPGVHGSSTKGNEERHTHTQTLVMVFYLKDKGKKYIYLGMSNFF